MKGADNYWFQFDKSEIHQDQLGSSLKVKEDPFYYDRYPSGTATYVVVDSYKKEQLFGLRCTLKAGPEIMLGHLFSKNQRRKVAWFHLYSFTIVIFNVFIYCGLKLFPCLEHPFMPIVHFSSGWRRTSPASHCPGSCPCVTCSA